jgi:hypothetical protein
VPKKSWFIGFLGHWLVRIPEVLEKTVDDDGDAAMRPPLASSLKIAQPFMAGFGVGFA